MSFITATVQIGNSDNKLTQEEWSRFVSETKLQVEHLAYKVHFFGGSATYEPWQNVCWVIELTESEKPLLLHMVAKIRGQYKQDSVAVTIGHTFMV